LRAHGASSLTLNMYIGLSVENWGPYRLWYSSLVALCPAACADWIIRGPYVSLNKEREDGDIKRRAPVAAPSHAPGDGPGNYMADCALITFGFPAAPTFRVRFNIEHHGAYRSLHTG
jgi:hypothetical protein